MHNEFIIPDGVETLIVALCADYSRRAEVICNRTAPYNVIMEYRFLNYRIMNAAIEAAGPHDAMLYIQDIGGNIGYASSDAFHISERTYKRRKKEVKYNIARRLSLI